MIHRPERERELQSPVSCSLGLEASGGSVQSVQLTDNRDKSSATPYQETENRKKGTGGALTSAAVLPGDLDIVVDP